MKISNVLGLSILLLVVSVSVISQTSPNPTPTGQSTQAPTPKNSPSPNDVKSTVTEKEKAELQKTAEMYDQEYNNRWVEYRTAYLGCTILAMILTAIIGLLPKLQSVDPNDAEAKKRQDRTANICLILGAVGTLLAGVNTLAGFSGAAAANRAAREAVREFKVDLIDNKIPTNAEGLRRLNEIEKKKSEAATKV